MNWETAIAIVLVPIAVTFWLIIMLLIMCSPTEYPW